MKLKYTNKDAEEEYLEVHYFSFMKCYVLSYLGFLAIVFVLAFIFALLIA